jgi:hypothetical protein
MRDPFANRRGHPPEEARPADDPADASTLAALRRLAAVPPPRPAFARSLKEELMHAPMPHAMPLSRVAPWSAPRPRHAAVAPGGGAPRSRGLNALATAALLLVTSVTIYLVVVRQGDGDGAPPTVPAFAAATSGTASAIEGCQSLFTCPNAIAMEWSGGAFAPGVDLASLGARDAQLQGWTLDPGATLALPAAVAGDPQGVVVDFVVSGTYLAAFDVPVMVRHLAGASGISLVKTFDSGTPVELGRGESVSYQLGGLTELGNPLGQRNLHFKRAVFSNGDVTATPVTGAAGVTMRVNGDGQLRQALGTEDAIGLVFMNIPPGVAFPPEQWEDTVIIGPVNAETSPEGTQGYVLRAGFSMG